MKTLLLIFAIGLLPGGGLKGCAHSREPTVIRESCGVLKATIYSNGRFSLSAAEQDALSAENTDKIVAIKNYYRDHCLAAAKP